MGNASLPSRCGIQPRCEWEPPTEAVTQVLDLEGDKVFPPTLLDQRPICQGILQEVCVATYSEKSLTKGPVQCAKLCKLGVIDNVGDKAEEELVSDARKQWAETLEEVNRLRRASEFLTLLDQARAELRSPATVMGGALPANRYGTNATMPVFVHGHHVPILALINPNAGAMAGSDILAIARTASYYQDRFFNIIEVVKDRRRGGLLDVFRIELCKAKDEAKAMGTRPRVISGGGDGTASFTLFMVFSALRADDARAEDGLQDKGNGFIWTDDELAESFPALAQMPLGSANDFGHTLGWGKKYPGDGEFGSCGPKGRSKASASLEAWIEAAIDPRSRMANFDLFGIMPLDGEEACDFRLCELAGPRGPNPKVQVDSTWQLLMKEACLPVPLFVALYFSLGFAAYMTARFQLNRRRQPLHNKLEYVRQATGIVVEKVPPQLNVGLDGVQISCGGEHYFPPRCAGGSKYREVGFLNINWQAGILNGADRAPLVGRMCSSREPAKFNDCKMDMYRCKFASFVKNPGLRYQTDKKEGGMTVTYNGSRGKGVFFQWDGEARFAFSPSGEPFHIHVRRMLNIPVLLGPEYDPRVTGDPYNGCEVHFRFAGDTVAQQEAVRHRILRGVRGELNVELNASRSEMINAGLHCEVPR